MALVLAKIGGISRRSCWPTSTDKIPVFTIPARTQVVFNPVSSLLSFLVDDGILFHCKLDDT